jgi:predicted kinase
MRTLECQEGSVLLVAGVPGAGKTTLLRRLGVVGATVLDSEDVAARYRRVLDGRGYRLYRCLVHAEHHVRVAAAVLRPGSVIVHDTGTRALTRRLLALLARAGGHPCHALFLDVPLEAAEHGQHQRGRVVPPRSMRRHAARWARLRARLRAGDDVLAREGYASWLLLTRPQADAVRALRITPASGGARLHPAAPGAPRDDRTGTARR